MRRYGRFVLVALLGVFAALGLTAFKGGFHCRGGWSPEQVEKRTTAFVDNALDDIKATPAQRAKAQALRAELVKDGQAMREGHGADRDEMLKIFGSNNPDPAQVHALVDARLEKMRAFAHEAADAALELHQTLTPQQRAQLLERIKDHMPEE